ncbi:MAG: sigma 54-interacting transcriptional regulator, partial [Rhodospirillaceae bacterium]|nr:sigma 54-interacting transcriptional regulator [Rhodospirillaceae bacterium]
FMGRSVVFKEVECRAASAPHCRIVGKPVEQWDDIETELRALQPEVFANRRSDQSKTITPVEHMADTDRFADDLIGASPGFNATCHLIQKVADTNATVLFLGETGVGKEIFARTLHRIGPRGDKPFIAVNCAAIPENLVEAELFGVEKGAYTGAVTSRPGRFERAEGGTLFLDEIGSLNLQVQIKLLRALQEKEIERVGGTTVRKANVRIVAATNESLDEKVRDNQFREDLLFRLNVFPINIPPLRERRDDIPLLMGYFLQRYTSAHSRTVPGFTEQAVDALYEYDYPGNVRELENLIERAVILVDPNQPIDVADLFADARRAPAMMMTLNETGNLQQDSESAETTEPVDLLDRFLERGVPLGEMEGQLLQEAVTRADGNLAKAARTLGLTRPQLAYRLKKSETIQTL